MITIGTRGYDAHQSYKRLQIAESLLDKTDNGDSSEIAVTRETHQTPVQIQITHKRLEIVESLQAVRDETLWTQSSQIIDKRMETVEKNINLWLER